jgi:hypothetical protein
MEDEAAGADRAKRYLQNHPLLPTTSPLDQAQGLAKVPVAIGTALNGMTDALGDGLGLHRWDQMSLKELSRRYSQNPTVANTMVAMENGTMVRRDAGRSVEGRKEASKSTGRCYMYAQLGLAKGGLTPDAELRNISGVSAKRAGEALTSKKYGFVNLLDMPQFKNQIMGAPQVSYDRHGNKVVKAPIDAIPMGAVLVYGGTGDGHIEMRTPDGYASDYIKPYNRTAGLQSFGGRVLIGVYIRPDLVK